MYASFFYAGKPSYLRECSYVFNEARPRREWSLYNKTIFELIELMTFYENGST